ncbi:MAG: hypothetical protein GX051_09660 [Clostridiales bacterium]|nr:hypothetical protein [Clostridiales bacterium]
MLTRNYYNCLCYSAMMQSAGTVNNGDDPFAGGNLYCKGMTGGMALPNVTKIYMPVSDRTYPETSYMDGYGLWPCGSADNTLECAEVTFDTYAASTPMLNPTQIQASNHIVSDAVFDSVTNKWSRKIKRSFKNISGGVLYIYEQTWSCFKAQSAAADAIVLFDLTKLATPLAVNADEFFTLEMNLECAYPEPA